MTARITALAVLLPLTLLAACNSAPSEISTNPNAVVRVVNAANGVFDVVNADSLATDNTGLGYGGKSTCLTVVPSSPRLVLRDASSGQPIAYTQQFSRGRQFTVVAYPGATGAAQVAILDNTYRVTTGQAGLNLFNGVPGSGNLSASIGGTAVSSGVAYGRAGTFSSVPAGDQTVTINTGSGTPTLLTAPVTLYTGVRSTIIVTPGAGGVGYRALAVTSC